MPNNALDGTQNASKERDRVSARLLYGSVGASFIWNPAVRDGLDGYG